MIEEARYTIKIVPERVYEQFLYHDSERTKWLERHLMEINNGPIEDVFMDEATLIQTVRTNNPRVAAAMTAVADGTFDKYRELCEETHASHT